MGPLLKGGNGKERRREGKGRKRRGDMVEGKEGEGRGREK